MVGWVNKRMKDKKKIVTIVLLMSVLILMIMVFYIGFLLVSGSKPGTSQTVGLKKVKASNVSYSKLIVLAAPGAGSQNPSTIGPTSTPQPTVQPTGSNSLSGVPSPTEIILALNNVSGTPTASASPTKVASSSPTVVKSLPQTGYINGSVIFMTVAGILVFLSFVF